MLRIPCPWCGDRPDREFRAGGEATVVRPPDPNACSDEEWGRYLYERDNPKGLVAERWYHVHGCRRWFVVQRDTHTHALHGVRAMGEA